MGSFSYNGGCVEETAKFGITKININKSKAKPATLLINLKKPIFWCNS